MKRKVKLFIGDILENIKLAEDIVKDLDYSTFVSDRTKNYAVIRCLEIIGEAAKHIPEDVRRQYPDIPWNKMAGMRDKVIHFYMGVDHKIVWNVVIKDLPSLKESLDTAFIEIKD